MRVRLILLAVLFVGWSAIASAHRLNEYLQATTISIEKDHLVLQLRLTPGVAVAPRVLADLNARADGTISEGDQRAYAERVGHDLTLTFDGDATPLRLASVVFPAAGEIAEGVGDILLTFEADLPSGGGATHRLTFANHYQSGLAVYLINCLLPRDPGIHVVSQDRSYDQASYQLHFTVENSALPPLVGGVSPRHPEPADLPVFRTFFWHGVRHILTGYDHLLFVSALVLGAATLWDLVKVVTAFTLAHSFTLALAALNLVHVSARVVEPLISASIICGALQNVFQPECSHGRNRLALAFIFGLFHGLGFAGGLFDLMHQMPKETILLALLGFSIGVEAGHQVVLLPLFAALKTARQKKADLLDRVQAAPAFYRLGSVGISMAGIYYLCVALTDHP